MRCWADKELAIIKIVLACNLIWFLKRKLTNQNNLRLGGRMDGSPYILPRQLTEDNFRGSWLCGKSQF